MLKVTHVVRAREKWELEESRSRAHAFNSSAIKPPTMKVIETYLASSPESHLLPGLPVAESMLTFNKDCTSQSPL